MAYARTVTAVSLDQFAEIIGIHPMIFNGCMGSGTIMGGQTSRSLFYQYSWQNHDQVGREHIAVAIAEAETNLTKELGWSPRPEAFGEVFYDVPVYEPLMAFLSSNWAYNTAKRHEIATKRSMLVGGGIETMSVIATNTPLVWDDPDNDGIKERWTLTLPTTVTDPKEIAVYFAATDRFNESVDEMWRIRPVRIAIAGGFVTIRGSRWQVVKPAHMEKLNPDVVEGIDSRVDANFAAALDVYRRYTNDTTVHMTATFYDGTAQTGHIKPSTPGAFVPYAGAYSGGAWNDVSFRDNMIPRLDVDYVAGFPTDDHGNVDRELARVICQLATGYLPAFPGGGDAAYQTFYSLFREDSTSGRAAMTPDEFYNPFGTWRGAVEAWRYVRKVKGETWTYQR